MDVVIREIQTGDYPAVREIFIKDLWSKCSGEAVALFFERVRNDENYKTLVATLNDDVVGFISTVTTLWIGQEAAPAATLLIQGLAVKNEYQNKGIGKRLLRHAEDYAKSKGINSILLFSGFGRAAAHAFYERNGYTTMTRHFGKNLAP